MRLIDININTERFVFSFGYANIFKVWVLHIKIGEFDYVWDSGIGWRKMKKRI